MGIKYILINKRGASATIIDECLGLLAYITADYNPIATAYLNINYKKPALIGKEHCLKAWVKKVEGKK